MPPLSYSANISDVFLVSFVSMMEHGRQFRRCRWRGSRRWLPYRVSIFRTVVCASQRMPSFTYLAVISPSHLPATDTPPVSSTALATDRLFLPFGSLRWYSYSGAVKYLMTHLFGRPCTMPLSGVFLRRFLSCPVPRVPRFDRTVCRKLQRRRWPSSKSWFNTNNVRLFVHHICFFLFAFKFFVFLSKLKSTQKYLYM